jgi:hypothetical protein
MTDTLSLDRLARHRRLLLWGPALVVAELLALALYLEYTGVRIVAPRYLLYPLVWIDASLLAVALVERPRADRRARLVALAVAVGYFLVLASLDGTVGLAHGRADEFRLVWLPPGWGPALVVSGAGLAATVLPFKVVGYTGLAYLVYVVVLEAAGPLGSVVGLGACVGCTAPGLVSLLVGTAGSAAVASVVTALSYDLSTLVFLLALGLLYWRPMRVPLSLPHPRP